VDDQGQPLRSENSANRVRVLASDVSPQIPIEGEPLAAAFVRARSGFGVPFQVSAILIISNHQVKKLRITHLYSWALPKIDLSGQLMQMRFELATRS
jgi:hypothetical protein